MDNYICKIASIDEMNTKWDYEIDNSTDDKENWIIWKKDNIERFPKEFIIPYYGLLDGGGSIMVWFNGKTLNSRKLVKERDWLLDYIYFK